MNLEPDSLVPPKKGGNRIEVRSEKYEVMGGLVWKGVTAGTLYLYTFIRYDTPTRIVYIQTLIQQIKAKQTKVQHLIQEYCTSLKAGILYNRENRNFVQHRKQEYCTSLTN